MTLMMDNRFFGTALFVVSIFALGGCETATVETRPAPTTAPVLRSDSESRSSGGSERTPQTVSEGVVLGSGLDQLRVGVSTVEIVASASGGLYQVDEIKSNILSAISDYGYAAQEGDGGSASGLSQNALRNWGSRQGLDVVVGVAATSKPFDRIGNFFIYEATGEAKIIRVADGRLLGSESFSVRGERKLEEDQARRNAVARVGDELVPWTLKRIQPSSLGLKAADVDVSYDRKDSIEGIMDRLSGHPAIVSVRSLDEDPRRRQAKLRVVYTIESLVRPIDVEIAELLGYRKK